MDSLLIVQGKLQGNGSAKGVADEKKLFHRHCINEGQKVCGKLLDSIASCRMFGISIPADFRGIYGDTGRRIFQNGLPPAP